MHLKSLLVLFLLILIGSCEEKEEMEENFISLISITSNGAALANGNTQVAPDLEVAMVFDAALDAERFKDAFSLRSQAGDVPVTIAFSNAASRATITAQLDYATDYTLSLGTNLIGQHSGRLAQPLTISFRTLEDEVVRAMPPCTSPGACLEKEDLGTISMPAYFNFYSSFPIFHENAQWEALEQALIVVHGQNRDAREYFSYLSGTLATSNLSTSTILIAPWFKAAADAEPNDLYWSSSDWREGQSSSNALKLSSFAAVDSLVKQLANKDRFPVLRKIIFTGHSSGGLFAQLYGGFNKAQPLYPELEFEYVAANSQYFYYPGAARYNEQSQQFYVPADCFSYNYWPLGASNVPSYLSGTTSEALNAQFIARPVTYLLGNGTGSDGSLNTTDCEATLLGSSRHQRGENIYRFMDTFYSGQHVHAKAIVSGIGHDGERMYKSPEFIALLKQLIAP